MKHKSISYAKWGYIFLIPFFVVYAVFSLYPLLLTFINSFKEYIVDTGAVNSPWMQTSRETIEWCGFKNYVTVFSEPAIVKSFSNTIAMWLMGFIPQIAISLLLATWFTDIQLKLKAQGFFKAVIYLPNVIMASAIAFMFYTLFSKGGALYDLFCTLRGVDESLLSSSLGTKGVVAMINFLLWYGNTTILLMAAILGVDTSLYESAQIDGANPREIFWQITIPLIRPILSYVLVTSLIGGLQMYDVPALLTNNLGDPYIKGIPSAMTLVMQIQNRKDSGVGIASALCIVIFIISAVLGFFIMNFGDDKPKKKKKKK